MPVSAKTPASQVSPEQIASCGIPQKESSRIAERVRGALSALSPEEAWRKISREILSPALPFALHRLLFQYVYREWDYTKMPPPAWLPEPETVEQSNIMQVQRELGLGSYKDLHAWSNTGRNAFWDLMIHRTGIRFTHTYNRILDMSDSVEKPEWLPGAALNIAASCFNAPAGQPAIVYRGEDGTEGNMTYRELAELSCRVANGLRRIGLVKGDAVGIDMTMTAEAVAVYLGILRMGGVVVSIADSLAADEIRKRLKIAGAKAVFTQDYSLRAGKKLPMYEKVAVAGVPGVIVLPSAGRRVSLKLRRRDMTWNQFLPDASSFEPVSCRPSDPVNYLFSSGTTGDPKAIPWTHVTVIKCVADGFLHHDIKPGDVVAWPTNLGWMMGPWLIFATLVNKGTIALYYGAPATKDFCKFVSDANVKVLGTVPSIVRRWIETDCTAGTDWSRIKLFSSTGECSNRDDMLWLMSRAGYKPVIEYCGGTEIGGGYITGTVVQPCSPATFSTPALGLDFLILDEDGKETGNGELFIVPPSIGLSTSIVNKDHHQVYYKGVPPCPQGARGVFGMPAEEALKPYGLKPLLRRHGDQMMKLGGGYFRALGRMDDTMNLGGIKVSSAEIEQAVSGIKDVKETAAVGVNPPGGGPGGLVLFVVLKKNAVPDRETLKQQCKEALRSNLNPLFHPQDVVIVEELPRTASNKVMRRVLRDKYCFGH